MAEATDFYVSTTCFPDGSSIEACLEALQGAGIGRVEIGSNHAFCPTPAEVLSIFPMRLLVHNYFPPAEEPLVVNIASADDGVRTRSLQYVEAAIQCAAQSGAELYTLHPGFLGEPQTRRAEGRNFDLAFEPGTPDAARWDRAFERMLRGLERLIRQSQEARIPIAIETQGSATQAQHLLMQRIEEFEALFAEYGPEDLGITVNLAHAALASQALGQSLEELLDCVAARARALELSHPEDGLDAHLPLREDGWYWRYVVEGRFDGLPKILEYRDCELADVVESLRMCEALVQNA